MADAETRPVEPLSQQPDALRSALEVALGAQYTVVRLLGQGGMGAVYLAQERLLERFVAIKVLPSEHASAESRERFLREARTAARLSHPNIVPLLSFGEMGDTLFYIMRYIDGESLEARLRREGRLSPQETRRILAELADALAEAHRVGVVHRDIKPDNVMLERGSGRPMLTDFGIARQFMESATITGTGMIVGSPQYMSPEQASGDRALDGRSDLYSLGIVGYRMLTGRLPFTGESTMEVLAKQMTAEPERIATYAPDAPVDLMNAIARCLEKDAGKRWPDGSSLKFALAGEDHAYVVPDELEGLPRAGTRALVLAVVLNVVLTFAYAYSRDPVWIITGLAGSIVGISVPVMVLTLRARRFGLSMRRGLAMAFWPLGWFNFWWPNSLRPPGDVWNRLPPDVSRARRWQSWAMGVMMLVSVPLSLISVVLTGPSRKWIDALMLSSVFTIAGALAVGVAAAVSVYRRASAWRLTSVEVGKLLTEPTHGSRFWARPAIAAVLTPPAPPRAEGPKTVEEVVTALRGFAKELPSDAAQVALRASDVAGDLATELRVIERRIGELAQQVDVADQRRLEARVAALGPERADEPEIQRQMRVLLVGQGALFAGLETSRAQLQARRDALNEQVQTLWLQMVTYRAQVGSQSSATGELSARIDELCMSIERRGIAIEEAQRIAHGDGGR